MQRSGGLARAHAANDAADAVGGDQTLCGCHGKTCVDAASVATLGRYGRAIEEHAALVDFGNRQFCTGGHVIGQRFQRAGEAQQNADFRIFRMRASGEQSNSRCSHQYFFHLVLSLS